MSYNNNMFSFLDLILSKYSCVVRICDGNGGFFGMVK